jgi:hypothetical protein
MILVHDLPTGSFSDLEACSPAEPEVNNSEDVDDDWKTWKHSEVASFQVQTESAQKKQAQVSITLWNVNTVTEIAFV